MGHDSPGRALQRWRRRRLQRRDLTRRTHGLIELLQRKQFLRRFGQHRRHA